MKTKALNEKLNLIRKIYKSRNANSILFEKQNNLSWLFQGRTHVNIATVSGVVDVLVNDTDVYLITNNIEAKRITEEEFPPEISVIQYYWYEINGRKSCIHKLTEGNYTTDSECESDIQALRLIMSDSEKAQYIELGRDTAEVMQEACMCICQGMTEFKAAGIMAEKFLEREIDPIILLVAADERIFAHRHPLPTSKAIDDYVMLVAGGRRYGQIACITRFVKFSEIPDDLRRKRDAVLNLDTLLTVETRPGASTAAIFNELADNYSKEGYPDEWKLHHQGGLTGYNSREYKARFDVDIKVQPGQVFAWNPSITGFKAEDTFIVGESSNLVLTETKELPKVTVKYNGFSIEKPDILIRK